MQCGRTLAAWRPYKSAIKWGFIDTKGNVVVEPQFVGVRGFSEGFVAVRIYSEYEYKWGFIDTGGNVVIEPQFSDAMSFSEGIGGRTNLQRV